MGKPEISQIKFTPGSTIQLNNQSNVPQRYKIEFGEYGSITFDSLAGAEVKIECGNLPPQIHLLETDYDPGVRPIQNPKSESW